MLRENVSGNVWLERERQTISTSRDGKDGKLTITIWQFKAHHLLSLTLHRSDQRYDIVNTNNFYFHRGIGENEQKIVCHRQNAFCSTKRIFPLK